MTALTAVKINGLLDGIDAGVSQVLEVVNDVIFFSIGGMPIIVIWLLFAGVFFIGLGIVFVLLDNKIIL